MPPVEYAVDSQVAVITLANGSAGNVLNQESLEALHSALTMASQDDQVRVIVLRAQGQDFCLGMDLAQLPDLSQNQTAAEDAIGLYVTVLSEIYSSPKPVLCLVHGAVKAGGIGLVGACDIVLASEQASFELSEVILGLIPANVMPFIYSLRLLPQTLKYLILSAKKVSAQEALRLNLADEVFPPERMATEVKAIISKLFRASPRALAHTKQFTRQLAGKTLEQSCVLARDQLLELINNPEVIQAIRAFNDGHTPSWFGKYRPKMPLLPEGKA
jgi:methylglutaconyl-CoA hydratase